MLSDGGPVERWGRLMDRPEGEVLDEVVARVVEGSSLGEIARDWGLPRARFIAWMSGDDERRSSYEGALRMRADELVHESLVDAEASGPLTASGHKLKVAGLWDSKRFGKGDGVAGMRVVVVRFGEGNSSDSSASLTQALEHGSTGE